MEIANLREHRLRMREASQADRPAVHQLLRRGAYTHLHVDWRMPSEWLVAPGAAVVETAADHPDGPGQLRACLALGADPPPAAWVRIFVLKETTHAPLLLRVNRSLASNRV